MAVILSWCRRMYIDLRLKPGDEWRFSHPVEAGGRTVGLIGYGTMGQALAQRAKAFGMRVVAMARQARPKPSEIDEWFAPGQLNEMLAISDFVVLAVPKTPETVGLIGDAALRAMKPDALLVDLSGRDSLYDLKAIVQALEEKRIGGACLQLPLPPADSKLWKVDNLILSYHRVVSVEEVTRCTELFFENLKRYRAGQPLLGLVDKEAGY
jgi:phosphoglycerate dehydrogenase-like enzyme